TGRGGGSAGWGVHLRWCGLRPRCHERCTAARHDPQRFAALRYQQRGPADRDRPGPHRLGRHTQPRHTTSSTPRTRTRNPTPVTQRRDTMIDLRPRHMVFVAASAVTLMTAACGGTTIDDAAEEDTGGPTGTADPDAEKIGRASCREREEKRGGARG